MNTKNVSSQAGKMAVLLILAVVILAVIGGFFYFWKVYLPKCKVSGTCLTLWNLTKSSSPKLFGKGDYKVEERQDAKYIVVDKVGLTAKVPEGWRVEFEGTDMPDGKSEYWVNLMSEDAEMEGAIKKGCGISIMINENDEENVREIRSEILSMKNGEQIVNTTKKDYKFELRKIGNSESVYWMSPDKPTIGSAVGLNIPVGNTELINIGGRLLPNYQSRCLQSWENFVKNITIK